MLCLAVDASISVTVYVPFSSKYHNPKWIRSCKKWQIWWPDSYEQWQLNCLCFGLTKVLWTLYYKCMLWD